MFKRLGNHPITTELASNYTKSYGVLHSWIRNVSTTIKAPNMPCEDSSSGVTSGLDATQVKLMEEECIIIDNDDKSTGTASKKECHLLKNIDKGMLHRAFSVFLFNSEGKLLLQQRSQAKITYPDHWTNTCCSHPLNIEGETVEENALGVRRAAQRKLNHELGILPEQVALDKLTYLTRIHYKASNVPEDGKWGEHEIDYILFMKNDVRLNVNPNEVKDWKYVNPEELQQMLVDADEGKILVTPWFKLIVGKFLTLWWKNLDNLDSLKDQKTIHKMC